jgi:hypothetical protein
MVMAEGEAGKLMVWVCGFYIELQVLSFVSLPNKPFSSSPFNHATT